MRTLGELENIKCCHCAVAFLRKKYSQQSACPSCRKDIALIHKALSTKALRFIQIAKKNKGYKAVYTCLDRLEPQDIIAYESPFTSKLFIGVIKESESKVYTVVPIDRETEEKYNKERHRVPVASVLCWLIEI